MKNKAEESNTPMHTQSISSAVELRAIASRIRDSGVLGRSRVYAALLDYLVDCSINGKTPKEIEIAVDVLGRQADFDVTQDSSVRVYIHQLRKKLESYFAKQTSNTSYRIIIPKGQYTILAVPFAEQNQHHAGRRFWPEISLTNALLLCLSFLFLANLWVLTSSERSKNDLSVANAEHPLWRDLLDDELPILLVMGDYYIFGELSNNGDISRMVREFNINSRRELEDWQFSDRDITDKYLHLDLSYLPEGSAFALAKIIPVLSASGKRVNISMMSDLTSNDIRSNHIVYIGYISALDKLSNMTFAASGLQLGRSYDELLNLETREYYSSDAGLPEAGQQFRDYGLISIYPTSAQTQVVVIAGMRDAGLMQTAESVVDIASEAELLVGLNPTGDESPLSFEALYEVFGFDRMNFSGNLVYTRKLDANRIWDGNLTSYRN